MPKWVRSTDARSYKQWYPTWTTSYWQLRDSIALRLPMTEGVFVHKLCLRNRKCAKWHDCDTGMPK